MARVLLTGGAGYIASHTAVVLAERGHEVILLDNFANSERDVPERLRRLTGRTFPVIEADIRDVTAVSAALAAFPVDAVIHFAALKAVGESEADPLLYYDMNIIGTIRLLQAMQAQGVQRIVFSSSATVYGQPELVAHFGGRANAGAKYLWADQAGDGGSDPRPDADWQAAGGGEFAVFQSRGGASLRDDRRNPARCAE